jgi:sulfur-oxidizing protein SoxY
MKGIIMKKSIFQTGLAVLAMTAMIHAKDYRAEKPEAWTAKSVPAAIEALYGKITPIESNDIKLNTPEVGSNGGQIPVSIKTTIDAKSIAVLQDVNPESLVAVFAQNENTVPSYGLKIKMKKTGTITVIVEGKDGKFYSAKRSLEVALGGCEG